MAHGPVTDAILAAPLPARAQPAGHPLSPSRRSFLRTAATAFLALGGEPAILRRLAGAAVDGEAVATMTLRTASEAVRQGRVSSTELANSCLARIDQLQSALNAFITVTRDQALAEARQCDDDTRQGRWRGPLHGIPVALKDNIDTAGVRTSAGSALFVDRVPTDDAEVVRRLKAAGAVTLGKLNMDEFALGGNSVVSYFNPVHNPWRLDRSAGGSSGGAAAAVAAGLCFGALGTDTSGSLRIPAAFCSVVGLKPTYGRVSTRGVIPLSWTLDHLGPITRTVEDAALILQAIAGYDPLDTSSVAVSVPDYVAEMTMSTAGLRLGLPRLQFYEKLDPDVAAVVDQALGVLRTLAPAVRDVELPTVVGTPSMLAEEMYAYHARWFAETPFLYQLPTRRLLKAWADLSAKDYILARREIERLRRDVRRVFDGVDVLVTPTVKIQPRTLADAIERAESDKPSPPELGNTGAFNVFGLPAISVPCGFTPAGLPVGLQITGPHLAEGRVLALARAYEQATPWHRWYPRLAGPRDGTAGGRSQD